METRRAAPLIGWIAVFGYVALCVLMGLWPM